MATTQQSTLTSKPAKKPRDRMSVEEFLALEDDEGGFAEYVNGEVIRWSPTLQHQQLLLFLATTLCHFVEERDLGEVIIAAYKVRLKTDTVREPDILFVANEIRDRLTEQYLDGAPTLAVELISPESRTRDRRDKLREYADAGVLEYWLIDAERERAEFYRLDEDGVFVAIPLVEETYFRSVVLAGFWLDIDRKSVV